VTGRAYDAAFDAVLSRLDPERIHRAAFTTWRGLTRVPGVSDLARRVVVPTSVPTRPVLGKEIAPLGLAAGFDKNGEGIDALAALGFGAVEIGTVTGRPQPGNPRPRLFRLPADRAIVNRMGFNNDGSAAVAERLARRADREHADVLLGINIGKTKAVRVEDAVEDHRLSTRWLARFADYLVVNVSSPNTPGLRDLQAVEPLRPILAGVRDEAADATGREVPILVKIAPDLADDDIAAVAGLVGELGLAGVVATNTTITRDGLRTDAREVEALGAGGLSGPVLRTRAVEVLRLLRTELDRDRTVISVGGVDSAADVEHRLSLGADLVQAYTAFVYEGPQWPGRVLADLAAGERS